MAGCWGPRVLRVPGGEEWARLGRPGLGRPPRGQSPPPNLDGQGPWSPTEPPWGCACQDLGEFLDPLLLCRGAAAWTARPYGLVSTGKVSVHMREAWSRTVVPTRHGRLAWPWRPHSGMHRAGIRLPGAVGKGWGSHPCLLPSLWVVILRLRKQKWGCLRWVRRAPPVQGWSPRARSSEPGSGVTVGPSPWGASAAPAGRVPGPPVGAAWGRAALASVGTGPSPVTGGAEAGLAPGLAWRILGLLVPLPSAA